ncbi:MULTISPECIES: hypothetical protein [unclassified Lysobacter]|uniref:hypothetical protein n=1 Tax=unclassified Lysobacter TaxID=2635362 RepID=UPI0006F6DF0A|nr:MULTISPECIES: hypothetical protein [unclassified Lysobacter]KRA75875.1 hypothetical protein ASD78_07905 [Lysobacter sp. Root667]KRC36673.1 hypothetical protein ASE10_06070 [Lysobacter sp. Root76]KRD66769.1 hypothetical protein ASE45_15725 [Lysobacter sp. Root96]
MRLAPPPPDIRLAPRHEHEPLLRALALSLAALERQSAMALALSADPLDSAIDLPPGAPNAMDRAQLQAAAPLYFAAELEAAGLLPTAELIAGLFASGAITQPLGPGAQLINSFWRARRERLDVNERQAIFARVIETPYFERLMAALCEAIVAQADGGDLRERVALETACASLGEFLALRVDPMANLAARDIVANINLALGFLRDRMLQAAFGVNSLWQLVAIAGATQGQSASLIQRRVDQGRAGQTVLLWLAEHYADPAPQIAAEDYELIGAAQRWLSGRIAAPASGSAPTLSAAA